jgi:hypothetical protein
MLLHGSADVFIFTACCASRPSCTCILMLHVVEDVNEAHTRTPVILHSWPPTKMLWPLQVPPDEEARLQEAIQRLPSEFVFAKLGDQASQMFSKYYS